ncbi:MAG: N-acetylmuramoyl-L-alanine amidase family protein [Opitutales bacterium]
MVGLTTAQATEIRVNGTTYVSLETVAGSFGMDTRVLASGKKERLQSQWSRLDFEVNRRDFIYNGGRVYLGFPVAAHRSRLYISKNDWNVTLKPILAPQIFPGPPKLYTIVLDPGHGGKDPGARNTGLGLSEKDLTLDIARRLRPLLEGYGYKVLLTREDDRYLTLTQRSALANRWQADLFLSIHFNAIGNNRVEGIETFVWTPLNQPSTSRASLHRTDREFRAANRQEPWNALAGLHFQRAIHDAIGGTDRGLKRARFTVLRDLDCPGVLLELGFVSHPETGRNLRSSAYRTRVTQAVLDGVLAYQNALNRVRGKD